MLISLKDQVNKIWKFQWSFAHIHVFIFFDVLETWRIEYQMYFQFQSDWIFIHDLYMILLLRISYLNLFSLQICYGQLHG